MRQWPRRFPSTVTALGREPQAGPQGTLGPHTARGSGVEGVGSRSPSLLSAPPTASLVVVPDQPVPQPKLLSSSPAACRRSSEASEARSQASTVRASPSTRAFEAGVGLLVEQVSVDPQVLMVEGMGSASRR